MSAKAETLTVPTRQVASYVLAIVLALVIGATAGSVITQAFETDATATAADLWTRVRDGGRGVRRDPPSRRFEWFGAALRFRPPIYPVLHLMGVADGASRRSGTRTRGHVPRSARVIGAACGRVGAAERGPWSAVPAPKVQ
jgi:hypothetical protein